MNLLEKFIPIKVFVFDMDGVLTDGSLLILPGGEWVRKMNIKDGYALQLAAKKGYKIVVITGSASQPVAERLDALGVRFVFQKVSDKLSMLKKWMEEEEHTAEEVLYMGDDIPDLEVMQSAGLACCPADAVAEIKAISHYISVFKGGEGCVRDVIEKVLRLNNHWINKSGVSSI
jgi:3-deoxy-D-manno-octulosonate 8-phosphate phosphatase (KDO 8-P phosphatase)